MDINFIIAQMTSHAVSIKSLTLDVSDDQARWKPDNESWSILEVVNHLYDEERQDFRVRLGIILDHPDQPWPSIDPTGWVKEHDYNLRNLVQSVNDFLTERQKSLDWLKHLADPDWNASVEAPFGSISAGDMVSAWAAHDLLHLRQLNELHWAYLLEIAKPFQTNYAGEW